MYEYLRMLAICLSIIFVSGPILRADDGPLGEWPQFTPIGYITAPHPDNPQFQTHLYGDWGGIVGEEFIFIQDNKIKLLYHSYHETYLTEHPLQENILDNWALGYDPITKVKYTPLACPGGSIPGPAWSHTDTPGYIQHPITGEHLIYNTVRPGTKHLHPEWDGLPGYIGAIQVSTSDTPPNIGVPFDQDYENILVAEHWWEEGWNNNGEIKGGLSEPTPVWVPHLGDQGKVRLFYRGLNGSPGSYWNWRISYADSEDGKTGWVKNIEPTFDPSDPDNPAYQWTLPWPDGFSFRGSWQAHCTGDTIADGVHMIITVSNQNYAGYGHLAYYWSPDWGDTWISHPDNPIIAPGQFPDGVPGEGFQRTPTLVIDEDNSRYIIAYNAGHDISERWRRRTYLATAPRLTVLPGDANSDGFVTELDVTYLVDYLKGSGNPPDPMLAGDANGDCITNGLDVVYLVAFLKGGSAPFRGDCP
ncbi:MAG: dockerin type I repeat-containing protein [candidate division Zixibacteria bacterium]